MVRDPWSLSKVPFFALAAVASIVTFAVQERGGAVRAVQHFPLGARGGNALISYCRYLGKLFWPTDLAVFYPHPGHWQNSETLFRHALAVTENSYLAHYNLGADLATKGRVAEAIGHFQEAARLNPNDAPTRYSLATALSKDGQLDEAIRQYQEALRLKPDYADACNNLGFLWAERGENIAQARALIERAVQLEPGNPTYLDSMGWVLFKSFGHWAPSRAQAG